MGNYLERHYSSVQERFEGDYFIDFARIQHDKKTGYINGQVASSASCLRFERLCNALRCAGLLNDFKVGDPEQEGPTWDFKLKTYDHVAAGGPERRHNLLWHFDNSHSILDTLEALDSWCEENGHNMYDILRDEEPEIDDLEAWE